MRKEDITKEQFESYEAVRESGVTNMFAVDIVSKLSGLDRETIFCIMENYKYLEEKQADHEANEMIFEAEQEAD